MNWTPELQARFRARAMREKVPISGMLELTRRCNFRCIHCYLEPEDRKGVPGLEEISTAEACVLIDQFVEAGCLTLVITGGEPMLRRDFPTIYRHARQAGLLVEVFSNGTSITGAIIELFREFPPTIVDISMYGSTEATYAAVTGVKGAYARCRDGIRLLQEGGIHVGLKTMILRANVDEVPAMRSFAESVGARFRTDAGVCTRHSGGREPLGQRVDAPIAVGLELATAERRAALRTYYDRARTVPPSALLYECGAAVTGFSVDAGGILHPCLMSTAIGADAVRLGFKAAWETISRKVSALRSDPASPCTPCDLRGLCGRCPPLAEIETGYASHPVAYQCELGRTRRDVIEATRESEGAIDAR